MNKKRLLLLKNNRRAEAATFIWLISLLVLVVIILIGTIGFQRTKSTLDDSHMLMLANTIQKDIQIMKTTRGIKTVTYDFPNSVDHILLIDHSYKETLLLDPYIKTNPFVYDTIESGAKEDLFLFSKTNRLIKAYDIGTISLQQIGDEVCSGKAIINTSAQKIELLFSHSGDGEIKIGEECKSIQFKTFQGPFNDSMVYYPTDIPQVEISYDKRQFRLKKDISASVQGAPLFYENYTFYIGNITLNNSVEPYRIYYAGDELQNSKILLRLGFTNIPSNKYKDYDYYGPNISARNEHDPGYYYEYKGQFIAFPSSQFSNVSVMVILKSDSSRMYSPSLRWIQVGYREISSP